MKIVSKFACATLSLSILLSACNNQSEFNDTISPVTNNQEISSFAAQSYLQIQNEHDLNKDSLISRDEANLDQKDMSQIDLDNDGLLSKNEITGALQKEVNSAINIAQGIQTERNFRVADIHKGPIPTKPRKSVFRKNKVELFIDKEEILPMIFDSIKSAEKSIQLDLFILGGGIGLKVAYEVAQKAKEGVDVKITFDPNLGFAGPTKKEVMQVVNYFIKEGVDFKLYPLYLIPRVKNSLLANKFQIDHNKLINIDGKTFITGGFNLFDVGVENRDLMLKIEGPTAQEASELMAYEWSLGENFVDPQPKKEELQINQESNNFVTQAAAESSVRIVKTGPFEKSVKPSMISSIDRAKKSVFLSVLEFSDKDLIRSLVRAHKRGVDVRIILDRKDTNDKYAGGLPIPSNMPNILPAREFVKNKVPVRWYDSRTEGQEIHMKMCVVDGNRLITGSTNFTVQAFTTFRETSVEIIGGSAPDKMVRAFMEDWLRHSTPIKKLSLKDKLKAKTVEYLDTKYVGWW